MIGDFVLYNDDICIVDEIRVDNTAVLTALNTDVTSIDGDQVSVDEITPIPLTPEIVKKNGFKECTNGDWTNDNVDFILHRRKDGIFRIQNTNMTLPYVSSFQHALRLCGINKKIEI